MVMKVLFTNAPWEVEGRRSVRGGSRWPHTYRVYEGAIKTYMPYPFFLAYSASYAEHHLPKDEVHFRDSLVRLESNRTFLDYVASQNFDKIVFETSTPSLESDKNLIRQIKNENPKADIILIGQNIAYDGLTLLKELPVSACIKGESEKGVLKALKNEAKGLVEFDLLTQEEMNAAPSPWRKDESVYDYFDVMYFHGYDPVLQLWASRGCPFKCAFCTWPQSMTLNKVRYYSQNTLRHEIETTLKKFPKFKAVYFDDDTFNMGDKHVLGVCEVMNEFALPWSAMCRADTIKESTWEVMAKSGCVGVKVGVESGSQRIIDEVIHKNLKLDDVRHFVPFIRNLGIKVHGTFMYGNPTETEEEMIMTKKFIEEVGFDHIQESGAAPLAGTKLWNLNTQTHELKETDGKKFAEQINERLEKGNL